MTFLFYKNQNAFVQNFNHLQPWLHEIIKILSPKQVCDQMRQANLTFTKSSTIAIIFIFVHQGKKLVFFIIKIKLSTCAAAMYRKNSVDSKM